MPESRKRKGAQRSSGETRTSNNSPIHKPSPRWWAPLMVTLMLIGLLIVVVTYLSHGQIPIPGLGNWNLGIGFLVMIAGMLMSMGWS